MFTKIALFLFVAVTQATHCTRRVSTDPNEQRVVTWLTPMGSLCASLNKAPNGQWQARPRIDPAKLYATQAEAITWIETTYCAVDKK